MKALGRTAIILAIALAVAAIWVPAHWWQLLLSALLALFVGASVLGQKAKRPHRDVNGPVRRIPEPARRAPKAGPSEPDWPI